MDLQLFALGNEPPVEDEEPEEDLVEPEADEDTEEPEAEGDEPEGDEAEGDEPEGDDAEPKEKLLKQSEVDRLVQKRLERDRRSRPAVESLSDKAEVPALSDGEQVQALRLWTLLKHNPEISRELDKILTDKPTTMPMYIKSNKASTPKAESSEGDRYEALEAKLDLRSSDKLFRQNEKAIMAYAADEDIDTSTAKGLKLAYKAWKGEKGPLLAANAALKDKQGTGKTAAAAAKGVGRKGGARAVKINYRTASDSDILAAEGLKLFDDD